MLIEPLIENTNPPEWLMENLRAGRCKWGEGCFGDENNELMLVRVCRNCQSGQPSCICDAPATDWIPIWREGQGVNERLVKYLKHKKSLHDAEKSFPQFGVHTAEQMRRRMSLWAPAKGVPSQHPAAVYMRKLFQEGDRVLVQLIHGTETYIGKDGQPHARTEEYPRSLADATDEVFIQTLKEKNAAGWNIYITMNPICEESKRRRKGDIAQIRSVYCEADANGEECLNAMRIAVTSGEVPEPSYIISSSPNKYHFIWFVRDFIPSQQEALNKGLVSRFKTDPESVDCSRVLRLPSFLNQKPKYETPPMATVFFASSKDVRYSPSDFKIDTEIKSAAPMGKDAPPEIIRGVCAVIEDALTKAEITFSGKETKGDWIYKFSFVCPNPLHTTVDRYREISIGRDGTRGSHCYHSNCDGNDWKSWMRPWLEERVGKLCFPSAATDERVFSSLDADAGTVCVFETAGDVELAKSLGFTAEPITATADSLRKYSRVVLFGTSAETNALRNAIGEGAVVASLPLDKTNPTQANGRRRYCKTLTDAALQYERGELGKLFHETLAMDAVRLRSTRVKTAAVNDIVPTVSETDIPSFDASVMDGSIYKTFVELITEGTTLQPQYAYHLGRLIVSMLVVGRVRFQNLSSVPPLRRIVLLGETGSGKGESYRRCKVLLSVGGQMDKAFKLAESVDSGAGLKDMFFDEPVGVPVLVYIDEATTLGNKSSDKKNPDILDVMGELANSTTVTRTLSTRGGGAKRKASKTIDGAYLFWIMCAPDGMTFMGATAGRKVKGFNDRNIPVYGVPVAAGKLPEIPPQAISKLWIELYKIQAMVGSPKEPGLVTLSPEVEDLLEAFWKTQPKEVYTKVRLKQYLMLDAFLNAIGRGRMNVTLQDAEDAIKDARRELITRAACFREEAGDRVGFYYAALKRITEKMKEDIQKSGLVWGDAGLFEYGKSECDFEHESRANRNNEPTPFSLAWGYWEKRHLEKLPPQKAPNGKMITRYVPARPER